MGYFRGSHQLKILKSLKIGLLLVFYEKIMFLEFETNIFKNKKVMDH